MKIALAQMNPTVGDFDGNLKRILDFIERAKKEQADLCVFPEMCLIGYPAHDLLERPAFIDRNLNALQELAAQVNGIGVIVGFVDRRQGNIGKDLRNCAALINEGKVVSTHTKMLLPTYDVFDERRFFEPATEVHSAEFKGTRLGISICEDIWNDPEFWPKRLYDRDPVAELVSAGADLLVNISASPFTLSKRLLRPEMLQAAARHYGKPLVFVNQVGGNDDLVFDGHSLAFAADGTMLARGVDFEEDLVVVDIETGTGEIHPCAETDEEAALKALTLGTRDYAHKCGFKSAVLGLSGGIDSALVAVIGARALGPENVLGVAMPSPYSSPGSISDAEALVKNLGIRYEQVRIDDLFKDFSEHLAPVFAGREPDTTEENIQARIRGVILMALSNKFGHLLLTTGNKSEMAPGYCTLYGDMAGGLAVISDVPKTMVYRLAKEINREREVIPSTIINKPPSAELKPNQKDEDSLPPYPLLDGIIERFIERGMGVEEIVSEGYDRAIVEDVVRMIIRNEYKRRQMPPGLKISVKAFGPGRRIPIAQKWRS
jgi:NAD+ synthetase